MNLYQWEAKTSGTWQAYGGRSLSIALIVAGIIVIGIGVFAGSNVFKALVLAYVVLP